MGLEEAELVKHAANAFGATSISFANELARVCEIVGADAFVVTQALRFDQRVGRGAYIRPGGGFSGATLERDLRVLRALARRVGLKTSLLDAVLSVNSREERRPVEFLRTALGSLKGRKVGLLGLTYKPGTSTLRGAYSLKLARALAKEGTVVRGIDPKADPLDRQLPPELKLVGDVFAIASGADALVLITPWSEYLRLPWRRLRRLMRRPVLIDIPNALDGAVVRRAGFKYLAPGRPRNLHRNGR
jgi:UDPglucose 6-dehydrogenase